MSNGTVDLDLEASLTDAEVRNLLASPSGAFALLEMVRAGRIDAEAAVTAIEEAHPEPLARRLVLAFLDTLFSRKSV